MRNIYNIITDGFDGIGLDERLFIVTVENSMVTIKRPDGGQKSQIFLRIVAGNLISFEHRNELFPNIAWNFICQAFQREFI